MQYIKSWIVSVYFLKTQSFPAPSKWSSSVLVHAWALVRIFYEIQPPRKPNIAGVLFERIHMMCPQNCGNFILLTWMSLYQDSASISIDHYEGGMKPEPWIFKSNPKNPPEPRAGEWKIRLATRMVAWSGQQAWDNFIIITLHNYCALITWSFRLNSSNNCPFEFQ